MATSWLNLEGKTVVVTGGASGIGKAVAQEFLQNGANVVVCDINPSAPEFDEANGKFEYVVTDVTSRESVEEMVEKAKGCLWADRCVGKQCRHQHSTPAGRSQRPQREI